MAMFKCRISAAPYNDKVYLHSVLMVSIVSQIQIRVLAILLKLQKQYGLKKTRVMQAPSHIAISSFVVLNVTGRIYYWVITARDNEAARPSVASSENQ